MRPVDNAVLASRRWNSDEWLAAAGRGELPRNGVELINGEVVEMAAMGPRHFGAEAGLRHLLSRMLDPERWTVGGQSTVRLSELDAPEPDVFVARGPLRRYTRLPAASDLAFVAEVGDSSRAYDNLVKLPLYAEAGVPQLWLIDVVDRHVEIFTQPVGGDYASRVTVRAGRIPIVLDGIEFGDVDIAELLR